MKDDNSETKLKPASAAELEEKLSYALRFFDKCRVHEADEPMSRIAAERLVLHLEHYDLKALRQQNQVRRLLETQVYSMLDYVFTAIKILNAHLGDETRVTIVIPHSDELYSSSVAAASILSAAESIPLNNIFTFTVLSETTC